MAFAAMSVRLFADPELPKKAAPGPAGGDAALFRDDGGDALFPGTNLNDADFLRDVETPDLEKATAEYERAQRKEERWQKLWKAGVLAKVEAERATLQTARSRVTLAHARVAKQQTALEELRARAKDGAAPADAIASAESALQTAQAMAAEAEASLRRTELLLAEANVDRQRRLIELGAGSKTQLQRAENALANLKRPPP